MKVMRFTSEEEQTLWEKQTEKGAIFSGAVHMEDEVLNPENGFVNTTKWLFWVKSSTAEVTERNLDLLIANVKRGVMRPYRVFSETPFHDKDTEDINPTTGEGLGRYSQVRLGSQAKALELDRSYIEVSMEVPTESAPAVTTPKAEEPAETA